MKKKKISTAKVAVNLPLLEAWRKVISSINNAALDFTAGADWTEDPGHQRPASESESGK